MHSSLKRMLLCFIQQCLFFISQRIFQVYFISWRIYQKDILLYWNNFKTMVKSKNITKLVHRFALTSRKRRENCLPISSKLWDGLWHILLIVPDLLLLLHPQCYCHLISTSICFLHIPQKRGFIQKNDYLKYFRNSKVDNNLSQKRRQNRCQLRGRKKE